MPFLIHVILGINRNKVKLYFVGCQAACAKTTNLRHLATETAAKQERSHPRSHKQFRHSEISGKASLSPTDSHILLSGVRNPYALRVFIPSCKADRKMDFSGKIDHFLVGPEDASVIRLNVASESLSGLARLTCFRPAPLSWTVDPPGDPRDADRRMLKGLATDAALPIG
jgi:hypothetical protein